MDPVSQGALGASLSQSAADRSTMVAGTIAGIVGGMAPDLDVLIRSSTDPLLFLEYHRQFTHALIFIPVGAMACAAVLQPFLRRGLSFPRTYLFCLLGYATHGLLDACTSYGTQLLWPFSDRRYAWNSVSVIDPLFTIPLLALVIAAVARKTPRLGMMAFGWAIVYLAAGAVQHERALAAARDLAAARGHEPTELWAKPAFGNILLWKLVYAYGDRYYIDALRLGRTETVIPGESIAKLNVAEHFPRLDPTSRQARDIERFRRFSQGYLAPDHRGDNRIVDIRYSMIPSETNALWGIRIDPDAPDDQHAEFFTDRNASAADSRRLLEMILGSGK